MVIHKITKKNNLYDYSIKMILTSMHKYDLDLKKVLNVNDLRLN